MTLANYLKDYLGGFSDYLNWTNESDYEFIVSETLEAYGVTTENEATNLKKLHTLAKVETWKAVLRELAKNYDFSADGASYKRSQVYEYAERNFAEAMLEAIKYAENYSIEIGELTSEEDPYIREQNESI